MGDVHYAHEGPGLKDLADFDGNSSDWRYLGISNSYEGSADFADDSRQPETSGHEAMEQFSPENTIKLVLVTLIFTCAFFGNSFVVLLLYRTGVNKTLYQRILLICLAVTSIVRASLNFIRMSYILAFHNRWHFSLIICRTDKFLDHFAMAAFPYILICLVFDSTRVIIGQCFESCSFQNGRKFQGCCYYVTKVTGFIVAILVPIGFSLFLTLCVTTKTSIISYGEGNKVNNITLCWLDVDSAVDPFKTYVDLHQALWLIWIPCFIIFNMYACVAIIACVKRCQCMVQQLCDNNNEIILEERQSAAKNWCITVICLTIVYVVCFSPFEILNLLYKYKAIPYSKIEIMVVIFLFYIPPAIIPMVIIATNRLFWRECYKFLCCLCPKKSPTFHIYHDDLESCRSNHSICSSGAGCSKTGAVTGSPGSYRQERTDTGEVGSRDFDSLNPSPRDDTGDSPETACCIPSSPDLSQSSSQDDWGVGVGHRNRHKHKGKKLLKNGDPQDEDSTPILVTSL